MIAETSSPWTPPTAIESAQAETFPAQLAIAREIHAIPRGFGRETLGTRWGDAGSELDPRPGSLSSLMPSWAVQNDGQGSL